ncbi:energy-coupling factor transporter transmembrane component T [Clostridium pasteurianum]|uniref:ABC-type cobalt transport system, permease component CbiQ n=1 Tax=Clostridium pasteurianum BC1 TaxID=86416 RepID=R4KFY3_CLOPA|nr:energy-coupling factor transporter transmembrane component T [Clostridium pasteurianum]AGK98495.1 ABC-type cobalt transport system, permease component CbiQ [Clostridium pasteurianum BC1]
MNVNLKSIHVFSSILTNIVLFILIIGSDNPLILSGTLVIMMYIFISSKSLNTLKRGIIYFIPFAIITIIINLIFINQGSKVIFIIFNRIFTLEALVYSLTLSFKLLLVILLFIMLQLMIDSDKAVSFFSRLIPKTTLTMMISLKLFPLMQKRMKILKDIYSIRGIDFETKGLKNILRNLKPLFSVILEDSLESSFDIGEAAYIRGFLSTRRTNYDSECLKKSDYLISISVFSILLIFIVFKILGMDNFNAYYEINLINILNISSSMVFVLLVLLTVEFHFILKRYGEDN